MEEWKRSADKWEILSAGTAASQGRPDRIPLNKSRAKLGRRARSKTEVERMLREVFDGEEKIFATPSGQRINLNAHVVAEHIDDLGRSIFIPMLPEALENPFEEWH